MLLWTHKSCRLSKIENKAEVTRETKKKVKGCEVCIVIHLHNLIGKRDHFNYLIEHD